MVHTEVGFELLNKIYAILGDKIIIEREAKLEGRSITAIIGRNTKGKPKENNESQENKTENEQVVSQTN